MENQTYDEWERAITDAISEALDISNGDSQGIIEINTFLLTQEWAKDNNAKDVAKMIIDQDKS